MTNNNYPEELEFEALWHSREPVEQPGPWAWVFAVMMLAIIGAGLVAACWWLL